MFPWGRRKISGVVIINGPTEPNSTVLLQRKPGEQNYTAFDRIPAISNSKWSWDEAVSGQSYEISASLQVNEKDTSVGNILRVTVPTEDETITINTNFSLTPPTPDSNCNMRKSAGRQMECKYYISCS